MHTDRHPITLIENGCRNYIFDIYGQFQQSNQNYSNL